MMSLRGDVHKFYLKLRRHFEADQSIHGLNEIIEINEIQQFYHLLNSPELEKIRYRMIKEQKGNGIIPLLVSSLPWLAFIFSEELHKWVGKNFILLFCFLIIYTFLITFSTILHYREKSWASVHIEIIDDILKERKSEACPH